MKQILLIITVMALAGCHAGNAKRDEEAKLAAKAKAIAEARAVAETKTKAEQGDADAQFYLGFMYVKGQGVEQDFEEAVKWYRKAAEQRHAQAQYNLGVMYANGEGVEKDYVTAYAWLNIAAANGHKIAKDNKPKIVTAMGLSPELAMKQIAKAEALAKEMLKKNPKLLN